MGKNIFITDFDMKRFQWLISNAERFENSDKKHLWELEKELVTATIVDPHQIPSDIVTMHSKVRLRNMVSGEENVYTLVFPFDADLSQNRLSILAPEGVAIIGCKTGEEIELDQPAEMAKIKIEEILYQPEAQGNYYI